jgi:phosphatidylglycerophosphate synthase
MDSVSLPLEKWIIRLLPNACDYTRNQQMPQKQTAVTGHVPTRRTIEIEEITNLYLIHPLAGRLVPMFARLHVTPNAVSIVGLLFGILSAFAYYRYWDPRFAIAGFALMIAWHVMDGADGQLARYTQSYSYFGKMLDGIADHVTFAAVYAALAVTSSRRHGNWVYLLVAISAVFHAIQSASYETERQEYEYLGWGRKPQDPPPRNSEPRDRSAPGGIRWALDFLHRLFFLGLSFPTAGINGKFRATMAAALRNEPGKAVLVRQHYRETLAPQIRSWSVLSANYRTLGIFISTLFEAPEYYFGFEIVGFSVLLAVLIRRLYSAHEVLLSNLRLATTGHARSQAC